MSDFNPRDWYWQADDGRIFGSASSTLVDLSAPAFAAWCETGRRPTLWPCDDDGHQTDASLQAVLAPYGLSVTFAQGKAVRKAEIDAAAERARQRWITPGAGQAMTYARKVDQARAVQAAGDPEPADYPMLAASIGIDGATLTEVAATILTMDAAWETIGAAIEARRLTLKRDAGEAADAAALAAINIDGGWPE